MVQGSMAQGMDWEGKGLTTLVPAGITNGRQYSQVYKSTGYPAQTICSSKQHSPTLDNYLNQESFDRSKCLGNF